MAPPGIASEQAHYQTLALLKDDQWQIKYLYDRLSIVDNKTSALMRVNGVMMGFVTVAVFRVIELGDKIVPLPGLFLLLSTLILSSCSSLRFIVLVSSIFASIGCRMSETLVAIGINSSRSHYSARKAFGAYETCRFWAPSSSAQCLR